MKRIITGTLFVFLIGIMLVPTLVFAGTNQVLENNDLVKWLLGLTGTGFLASIGVVVKTRNMIKEIGEFCTVLKAYLDKQKVSEELLNVRKEADQALDSIADVLDKVKLKKQADQLRRLL